MGEGLSVHLVLFLQRLQERVRGPELAPQMLSERMYFSMAFNTFTMSCYISSKIFLSSQKKTPRP